jgi:hypothetical protein
VPKYPEFFTRKTYFCNSIYYKELNDDYFAGQPGGEPERAALPANFPGAVLLNVSL